LPGRFFLDVEEVRGVPQRDRVVVLADRLVRLVMDRIDRSCGGTRRSPSLVVAVSGDPGARSLAIVPLGR
jgi:hypothetical protein